MDTNAISIDGLTKSFKKVAVLKGINLSVEKGTVLALLGPNGAGKTTIIRILSTLLKPDEGQINIMGFNVRTEGNRVREKIGLTGQYAAVDEYLTGRENLEMIGRLYHLSRENCRIRAQELLEQFDLVDAGGRPVKTYSGGMRRRLDLAASLIATPPIIFLDEPTTGLDPRSRLSMWQIIEKLVESKVTILLTTQYLEEADRLADRIAVLDQGKIIAEGTADELKAGVGKERLELTVAENSNFKEALKAVNTFSSVQHDENRRWISVATEGSVREVNNVLKAMEAKNINLDSLSLQKPTLDDVFLHLTGHRAEVKAEEKVDIRV